MRVVGPEARHETSIERSWEWVPTDGVSPGFSLFAFHLSCVMTDASVELKS